MKGLNNILIIEDEESVAEVMKAYLEKKAIGETYNEGLARVEPFKSGSFK